MLKRRGNGIQKPRERRVDEWISSSTIMKIGIDISPLESGHKVRGVGFYLHHLKESLTTFYPKHEYIFFTGSEPVDPDITIIHYPYFDPYFLTLPLIKKHKTVVTVHDLTPLVFPSNFPAGYRGKFKWQFQRFSLKQCNAIITDSYASKRDIITYTGIEEKKIHVVYLAAGNDFIVQEDKRAGKKKLAKYKLPDKYILYVGDATWNKNLPRLLEAIRKVNIPLVMVGKTLADTTIVTTNPWNKDVLVTQKMARDNKDIYLLGFVSADDLVTLYNNATVTVLPSLYEGFGLTILEAMSCGSPVVTTNKGSIPEVAGQAVRYVDPQSSDSMAEGLQEVFLHENIQNTLREKGFEQIKKFSWQKTADETIRVYNSVTI